MPRRKGCSGLPLSPTRRNVNTMTVARLLTSFHEAEPPTGGGRLFVRSSELRQHGTYLEPLHQRHPQLPRHVRSAFQKQLGKSKAQSDRPSLTVSLSQVGMYALAAVSTIQTYNAYNRDVQLLIASPISDETYSQDQHLSGTSIVLFFSKSGVRGAVAKAPWRSESWWPRPL